MIYLLYLNKEIFLCELVFNVFDVVDKLCFEVINNGSLFEDDLELKIKISFDKVVCIIIIFDNGIGMNWDEVILYLGIIVKLGIKEFFLCLLGD